MGLATSLHFGLIVTAFCLTFAGLVASTALPAGTTVKPGML